MVSKVKKGDISKAYIVARLLEEGFVVLDTVSEDSRYDLVVETENGFKKIQAKTIYYNNKEKCYEMMCYTVTRREKQHIKNYYTSNEVDFLIGYWPEKGEYYIFPMQDVKTKQIRFKKPSKFSNKRWSPLDVDKYKNNFSILQ